MVGFFGAAVTLSGIIDKDNYAQWFSKNIIPAIRKEKELREKEAKSPIIRHIGLYGYKYDETGKKIEIDIQGDLHRLQTHSRPKYFGQVIHENGITTLSSGLIDKTFSKIFIIF